MKKLAILIKQLICDITVYICFEHWLSEKGIFLVGLTLINRTFLSYGITYHLRTEWTQQTEWLMLLQEELTDGNQGIRSCYLEEENINKFLFHNIALLKPTGFYQYKDI